MRPQYRMWHICLCISSFNLWPNFDNFEALSCIARMSEWSKCSWNSFQFRNTKIVFHNDIKSSASSNCTNHSAIKPAAAGSSEDAEDGLICLNPFHYEVTAEAEARFLKQENKTTKKSKNCDNKSGKLTFVMVIVPISTPSLPKSEQVYTMYLFSDMKNHEFPSNHEACGSTQQMVLL